VKYTSQQRAAMILSLLAGHEVDGVSNGALAKAFSVTSAAISQDLKLLQGIGFVETIPGITPNRYRLGPKLVQIAIAHQRHIEREQVRLDTIKQRYSREP